MAEETSNVKAELERHMKIKNELEKKIEENGQILEANDNVGMDGPLIDSEGYPRNDIDIYRVRQARQDIIRMQNDYKEILEKIHQLLLQYHAETRASGNNNETTDTTRRELTTNDNVGSMDHENENIKEMRVIVKVNLVSPNSPAEAAGLRVGDQIIEFGSITALNFNNDVNEIGTIVRHMQNQPIMLKVKRNDEIHDLTLVPKTWSGRGLLGCSIVLPDAIDI